MRYRGFCTLQRLDWEARLLSGCRRPSCRLCSGKQSGNPGGSPNRVNRPLLRRTCLVLRDVLQESRPPPATCAGGMVVSEETSAVFCHAMCDHDLCLRIFLIYTYLIQSRTARKWLCCKKRLALASCHFWVKYGHTPKSGPSGRSNINAKCNFVIPAGTKCIREPTC